MRVFGIGETNDLHGNRSVMAKSFSPHMAVLRRHFLPNMQFECCMILQGTLGGNFDIFAASGESTAWVLLWKPVQDQLAWGFVQQPTSTFSTPHLTRVRGWLCSGKKIWGRQPPLITPENERGDETNYLPPPKLFDDPDVPFGPGGPPAPPGPHDPSPAGDRENMESRKNSRERLPRRPSQPEPQLIPMFMDDGDDDQSPKEERQRGRSRSRDRVHNLHKLNLWLLQNLMMCQMKTSQIWTHHHQLDHHHQVNRKRSLWKRRKVKIAWANTSTFIFTWRWKFSNRGSTKSRERPCKVTAGTRRLTKTGSIGVLARVLLFCVTSFVETQASRHYMAARGSVVRRRERRMRSWSWHEQASVRMALITVGHNSYRKATGIAIDVQAGTLLSRFLLGVGRHWPRWPRCASSKDRMRGSSTCCCKRWTSPSGAHDTCTWRHPTCWRMWSHTCLMTFTQHLHQWFNTSKQVQIIEYAAAPVIEMNCVSPFQQFPLVEGVKCDEYVLRSRAVILLTLRLWKNLVIFHSRSASESALWTSLWVNSLMP